MANNQSRPPRRGPMGPGMGPGGGEKAKDFKSAVKRLVKELGKFKILIIIALILAIAGAVLSISAPNRLNTSGNNSKDGKWANDNARDEYGCNKINCNIISYFIFM